VSGMRTRGGDGRLPALPPELRALAACRRNAVAKQSGRRGSEEGDGETAEAASWLSSTARLARRSSGAARKAAVGPLAKPTSGTVSDSPPEVRAARPRRRLMSDMAERDPLQESLTGAPIEPDVTMELVRRAQPGDGAALDQFLKRYQDRLRRVVHTRLGARLRGRLESMDIVQETLQVAVRKIAGPEPRGPGATFNWLSKIALRQIHDASRRYSACRRDAGREVSLVAGDEDEEGWPAVRLAASTTLPDEKALRTELAQIVQAGMDELSERHRDVIVLRDMRGSDWAFVAAELGSPSAHAAQELHQRAWKSLRRILRPRLGPQV